MNVSGLGIIVFAVSSACVWLIFLFKKLRRLENERSINRIHADAKEAVHDKSLSDLIDSTNEDASRRHSGKNSGS